MDLFCRLLSKICKCPFALFDDNCLLGKIHLAVGRGLLTYSPDPFSITMNEAVVDIVYPGHYILLQQREVIVFLLYDRLFFLLEMTSPLIDVAVF